MPASPLGLAIHIGSHTLVQLLLDSRANVHLDYDELPLLIAIIAKAPCPVIETLVRAIADPFQRVQWVHCLLFRCISQVIKQIVEACVPFRLRNYRVALLTCAEQCSGEAISAGPDS